MELFTTLAVSRINVRGEENLENLPPEQPLVLAVSHIYDLEIPIAVRVLAGKVPLVIADISQHRNFKDDPFTYLALKVAGEENFLPIDYRRENSRWSASPFNPDNFNLMQKAQERGKAILIAAHNPSSSLKPDENHKNAHQLSEKGGVGAVYLASKTNSLILPITVDLHAQGRVGSAGLVAGIFTFLNRPSADVFIGQPLDLGGVDTNIIELVTQKRSRHETISNDEREQFRQAIDTLRSRAEILMTNLAVNLPWEKRGRW